MIKNNFNFPNIDSETTVVRMIGDIFSDVAYLDADTLRENIFNGCDSWTHEKYRTIDKGVADYLMDNLATIFMGLILNESFRDVFVEAVSIEVSLEQREGFDKDEFISGIRQSMKSENVALSGDSYTINLEEYNEDTLNMVESKLAESFEKVSNYSDAINLIADELDYAAKVDIGFCISNFMYLIRAFALNQVFFAYTRKIVDSVKESLCI